MQKEEVKNIKIINMSGALKNKVGKRSSKKQSISLSHTSHKNLMDLLTQCNTKESGTKVTVDDLISYCLQQIKDSHIKEIQNNSLTRKDKIFLKYQEYIEKENIEITLEEYIMIKLKIQ